MTRSFYPSDSFKAALLISIVAFGFYANSLFGEFVSDEYAFLVDNVKITSARYIPDYFTKGLWANSSLEVKDEFLYRPLSLVSSFLIYQVWGPNPFGFHLFNVLMHAANSLLVFFLLRRFFSEGENAGPVAGALIFALHPVHVESVAWIGGSVDILVSFFVLSSFLMYLRYRQEGRGAFLVLACLLYACALLSKEVAIFFPFIVLVYAVLLERKPFLRQVALFGCLAAAYFLVRAAVLGKSLGVMNYSVEGIKLLFNFIAGYVKLLVVPWPLAFYFVAPETGVVSGGWVLFSAAVLVLMLIFAARSRRALFALVWLFAFLAPAMILVFYERRTFAERFLYLPSVGFSLMIGELTLIFLKRYRTYVLAGLLAVLCVMGAVVFRANQDWKNNEVYFLKAIRYSPGFAGGYAGLAMHYERKGQLDKAIEMFKEAARAPQNTERGVILENIGYLYAKTGDSGSSISYYEKALAVDPGSAGALLGLGNNYWSRKDHRRAIYYYEKALSLHPDNFEACFNLAMLNESLGNTEEALRYYRSLLVLPSRYKYPQEVLRAGEFLKRHGQ